MKRATLGLLVAAAIGLAGASTSSAASTVSPSPYSTTAATGTFEAGTPLGGASCTVAASVGLLNTTLGVEGAINAATASACTNWLTSMTFEVQPYYVAIYGGGGWTIPTVELTTVGGVCRYNGQLNIAVPFRPFSTLSAAGTMRLTRVVSGSCLTSVDGRLTLALPGATITR